MSEHRAAIAAFLDAVRGRLLKVRATAAALYAIGALLLLGLAAPLLSALFTPAPEGGARYWLLAFAAAIVSLAALWGALLPARRWHSRKNVARYVGSRARPIASDLQSSVELAESENERFSDELVTALTEATAKRVGRLDLREIVPREPLKRPARLVGLSASAYVVALLAIPSLLGEGWNLLLASSPEGPLGGATITGEPLVGDLEIYLEFPAYTGREAVELPAASGDFRAMPGTVVRISGKAMRPATAAFLIPGEDPDAPPSGEPIPMRVSGDSLTAEFELTESFHYRFLLETVAGERLVEAVAHEVEIERDNAPKVELQAPAEELDVANMKQIELAFSAEDDYGLSSVDLVWVGQEGEQRLPLATAPGQRIQGKHLWDTAALRMAPGQRIAYHVEAADNDAVNGPNIGKSPVYYLRVFSPREKHEQNINRQHEMFERLVAQLGGRLVVASEDLAAHRALSRALGGLVAEIGTVTAALKADPLHSEQLVEYLTEMRQRLDGVGKRERELLERITQARRVGPAPASGGNLKALDRELIEMLEADVLTLADWLDRQQMENVLAITDEIRAHEQRLKELMEEYARTGNEAIKQEIDRELRALRERMNELAQKRGKIAEDVLDRFVNAEAMQSRESEDCLAEVERLLAAGDADGAKQKMEECARGFDQSTQAMEQALSTLRGDRFSEEQRALDKLNSELADLGHDQEELAEDASRLAEEYSKRAAEALEERTEEVKEKLSGALDRLKSEIAGIDPKALPGELNEDLSAARKRVSDIERMLGKGDIAEALEMARQAEATLESLDSELDAADTNGELSGPKARDNWRRVKGARSTAERLVDELKQATPSPDELLSPQAQRQFETLRARQRAVRERAERLADRVEQMKEMPGQVAGEASKGLRSAAESMKNAERRLQARDPSGARREATEAARQVKESLKRAKGAARNRTQWGRAGVRDEPVRIPSADDYRAPKAFREELLEAMKQDTPPEGFGELVKRYYEELVK